jgi:hypothetical protein
MVAAVSGDPVLVAEPGGRRKGSGLDEWSQPGLSTRGCRGEDDAMVLIGCFLPFVLALLGAVAVQSKRD